MIISNKNSMAGVLIGKSAKELADYRLGNLKLLRTKLLAADKVPMNFELKSDNLVMDFSTASFERIRRVLLWRFAEGEYQHTSEEPFYSDITVKEDKAGLSKGR